METEPNGPETRLVLAWPLTSPLQTYCSEAFRRHIPAPVAVCMRVCVCVCVCVWGGGIKLLPAVSGITTAHLCRDLWLCEVNSSDLIGVAAHEQ